MVVRIRGDVGRVRSWRELEVLKVEMLGGIWEGL